MIFNEFFKLEACISIIAWRRISKIIQKIIDALHEIDKEQMIVRWFFNCFLAILYQDLGISKIWFWIIEIIFESFDFPKQSSDLWNMHHLDIYLSSSQLWFEEQILCPKVIRDRGILILNWTWFNEFSFKLTNIFLFEIESFCSWVEVWLDSRHWVLHVIIYWLIIFYLIFLHRGWRDLTRT